MSDAFEYRRALALVSLDLHLKRSGTPLELRTLRNSDRHARGARTVFCVSGGERHESMVLKVFTVRERANLQYEFLSVLSRQTGLVVRPIFVDAERGVVGLEYVGATSAMDLIRTQGLRAALTACGDWLNDYARAMPSDVRAQDSAHAQRRFEVLIQAERETTGFGKMLAAQLVTAYEQRGSRSVSHLRAFGDVKPENFCITSHGGLVGVDGNPDEGEVPIESELASLLHWGVMRRCRIALRDGSGRWSLGYQIWGDRLAVLARMSQPIDQQLLGLMMQERLLREWIRLTRLDAAPELRALIAARLDRRRLTRF